MFLRVQRNEQANYLWHLNVLDWLRHFLNSSRICHSTTTPQPHMYSFPMCSRSWIPVIPARQLGIARTSKLLVEQHIQILHGSNALFTTTSKQFIYILDFSDGWPIWNLTTTPTPYMFRFPSDSALEPPTSMSMISPSKRETTRASGGRKRHRTVVNILNNIWKNMKLLRSCPHRKFELWNINR